MAVQSKNIFFIGLPLIFIVLGIYLGFINKPTNQSQQENNSSYILGGVLISIGLIIFLLANKWAFK